MPGGNHAHPSEEAMITMFTITNPATWRGAMRPRGGEYQ